MGPASPAATFLASAPFRASRTRWPAPSSMRRTLKSWAMPPASRLSASSRWVCRSSSSSRRRVVMSRNVSTPPRSESPLTNGAVDTSTCTLVPSFRQNTSSIEWNGWPMREGVIQATVLGRVRRSVGPPVMEQVMAKAINELRAREAERRAGRRICECDAARRIGAEHTLIHTLRGWIPEPR